MNGATNMTAMTEAGHAMGLLEKIAASLVSRARSGDQNAMAMIERVGAASRQPNASLKSKISARLIREAISGQPVARFGEDPRPPCPADLFRNARHPDAFVMVAEHAAQYRHAGAALVVLFACGPRLTKERLAAYAKNLPRSELGRFCEKVLVRAQAVQRVRETSAPVALVSEAAAWEFGP